MVCLPILLIWELMIWELNLRSAREFISCAINIIVVVCLTISSALRLGRYLEYRLRLVDPDQEQYYETKEACIIKDRLFKYTLKAIFDIVDTIASPDPGTEDANNRRNTSSHRMYGYAPQKYTQRGHSLPTPMFEQIERASLPGFLRCQCCTNSSPAMMTARAGTARLKGWQSRRNNFLGLPAMSSVDQVGNVIDFEPHQLCLKYEMMCSSSLLFKQHSSRIKNCPW